MTFIDKWFLSAGYRFERVIGEWPLLTEWSLFPGGLRLFYFIKEGLLKCPLLTQYDL